MQFTTVKRAIRAVHIDGDDRNAVPEVEQVQGYITFTPMLGEGDSVQVQTVEGPVTVVLTPIKTRISDGMVMHRGSVGVQLFAGGKGSEPSLIRWRATFSELQSNGVPLKLRDVIFDAKPGGEVDLTTVAPLANAPEPILRGPAGVSMDSLTVEGGDLVVWGRSESGVSELSRIKMSDVTNPAAEKAAADTLAKLKSALDAKADQDVTTQALAGKANKAHTHTSSEITDARPTPMAGMLVKYGDGGLFTVGAPTTAAHPATKKYVDDGLTKKSDRGHGHTIADVDKLTGALAGKASAVHQHQVSDVTGLQSSLDGKAAKYHTHAVDDVTGLATRLGTLATAKALTDGLAGKAAKSHKHEIADVTGLEDRLGPIDQHIVWMVSFMNHADTTFAPMEEFRQVRDAVEVRPNGWIIRAASQLSATEKKARPGDLIHVVETGETWEVS